MVTKLDVNSVECYKVFKDGNVFVRAFVNKKPAISLMRRLGRNRDVYVEVFYDFSSGRRVLVDFVN